ncbi:hypothetical protein HB364_16400 [Pseudoflavitalea sp. X16]|uniref:hypothetical protein n=1 Tax=Paraflavitalea devenefica TaxID=2716334 RepID=UPI00141E29EC|nr:hypothetical protein [Paraflavitalea devenefica]NII26671.1 hypothetical protein [Paraflavitalea devenefica]
MNNFQLGELIGVCVIIGFQLLIFIRTRNRISVYKSVFPDADNFRIIRPGFLKEHFDLHPRELLENLNKYIGESEPKIVQTEIVSEGGLVLRPEIYEPDKRILVELIYRMEGGNHVTDKIVYALNTYLIRNRGVASDFHLIKDVVERNTDAVEDDINQSISLPLYLGLLGTFLGIVFGLFQISGVDFAADPTALDSAISLLLDGVKIAMIASFTGLLFTVINSGYSFKGAKVLVEEKKNDFYTFIQIDLLPLLNQNINSTLFSLQSNLHKFNEEFKENVDKLNLAMRKNHDTILAQERILDALEKKDIGAIAKANVVVLKELQAATDKFSQFNVYLAQVNELVNGTKDFTSQLNDVIKRTDNLNALGKGIVSVFEENQALAKFLQSHYSSLDQSHQLITQAVNGVGNTLDETLVKLKEFTQERINEVQKITLSEINLMQEQYPEKWKKLDNLIHLETLNKNLSDIKMSSAAQVGSIALELESINNRLQVLNESIDNASRNGRWNIITRVWGKTKKVFGFN